MKHKKEHHKEHHKGHKSEKHGKMGLVQPMAHGGKSEHLKSMKKGHKDVSGK